MFLVLTGNEYGLEIDVNAPVRFIESIEDAEAQYQMYLEEYGAGVIYEVTESCLVPIKRSFEF